MFSHISEMILALGVFYSGIVCLNRYSIEYSKVKKEIKKRGKPSLILSFLKSAGITALAADSGKLVMYSTSALCYSGLLNFKTAFVCVLGSLTTAGASSFLVLIDERNLIYMIVGIGGIMCFIFRKSHREKLKLIALFAFSIGLLLFGIILIKDNFAFLGKNDFVSHLLTTFQNPFLMLLAGTVISFIMQSTAGFAFMIVGFWGSNLLSYEQSLLMLYGGCISSCIKSQLYALLFKGSARRLLSVNANVVLVSSIITIGFYFLEEVTSIPLLNSFLRSICRNIVFEVSGVQVISILFVVFLNLLFLKVLVKLYTKFYPDDPDEILAKVHYVQDMELLPESQWPALMNKEVDRIVASLYKLVDIESSEKLVNAKTICDSNELILNKILDFHKYLYEGKDSSSLDAYLLYERLFFLKYLSKRLIRYCEIITKWDKSSENIFEYAVSIHVLLVLRCLSDFINNKTDTEELDIMSKSLNFSARKLEVFNIVVDVKGSYDSKFELFLIYAEILDSLNEIISSYKYKYLSEIIVQFQK